ncbi:type IV pilus modification protein PilV [Dyella sp. 2HG41-7]|uniref:type IV pilus modification protein PilV n=1 Tax=Dyella sp. 2HG41-7 TaxID=2883239 RepID=UPI001F1EB602|nr:type IV pilus modification protein PilV [Dyella sp. 2HG41-7]
MSRSRHQQGVTLIEVLTAMLVFSVGLIGAAELMLVASHVNHTAYLRTQVAFVAQNMVERMQANLTGVWRGDYNGTYPDSSAQDCSAGCTPQRLALHDRQLFGDQLKTFLPPNAQARVLCSNGGLAYVPTPEQWAWRPPYGGNCAMTVTWIERRLGSAIPSAETLAWEFQP